MGETTDNRPNNQEGQSFTAREFELIQELVRSRMEKNEELQYESFEGYELPPRTQFSMLKKPAVSIKYGQLTFNMAAIRLFEGVKHVLTVVNTEKKRLAVVPCAEEESASVEWARVNKQGKWVNKNITSVDFVENLYHLMGWNRECRYKVLGRVAASDRGLILVFEMEETSVYKGYKRDKIEMRGDRAEMSDFPLYLNTVAGGLDRRDQTIGGFSFVVKIYAVPVIEIIG